MSSNYDEMHKLHGLIKNHGYRKCTDISKNSAIDYHYLWKNMADAFEKEILDLIKKVDKDTKNIMYDWIHEFNSLVWELGYVINHPEDKHEEYNNLRQIMIVLETFLNNIHKYLDDEVFSEFATYYLGNNANPHDDRWTHYKLVKNKYVIAKNYNDEMYYEEKNPKIQIEIMNGLSKQNQMVSEKYYLWYYCVPYGWRSIGKMEGYNCIEELKKDHAYTNLLNKNPMLIIKGKIHEKIMVKK